MNGAMLTRRGFISLLAGTGAAALSGQTALAAAPDVAILAPFDSCAPGERGYAMRIAKHFARYLAAGGVSSQIADDRSAAALLSKCRLAMVVMCSTPPPSELDALRAFVARGGRLACFYATSAELAAVMGVKLAGYRKPAPGTFAGIVFTEASPPHAPRRIAQSSPNIFAAVPVPGKSRTIAVWCNRKGESTGEAAVLASNAGWWVTHVLSADGDERAKSLFLLSMAGASVPGAWNWAAWKAAEDSRIAAERAFCAAQKPRKGEIVAVWDQSGEGLYPGDWPKTLKTLAAAHVTDIYVNVCGAAFAHYPSKVLPKSKVLESSGDQLAACLRAARDSTVKVHAWMKCFLAERATPERLKRFSLNGWRLSGADGRESLYLDPSSPTLRTYLLNALEELVRRYQVDGVHLDFIRWMSPLEATRHSPAAMARFAAQSKDSSANALVAWRARQVEIFLAAARNRIKSVRPAACVSAAVMGHWASAVRSVGQDWKRWLDKGFADRIVPMDYTEKNSEFAAWTREQGSTAARAGKTIAGIGVTANESRLTAKQVAEQILLARAANLAGVAFFDLDYTLVHDILPILRAGVI